jgi:pimeloyl-ACP methyl ester carboxylesterase
VSDAVDVGSAGGSDWTVTRRWDSGDGEVAYDILGDGAPVVLVHGTPSSSYLWRHVAHALAETSRVHVFDLLGYGASDKHAGQDVSLDAQTRVLCGLLDHWELERPSIAGHDFGGTITLRAHLLAGRDFTKIALLDPVALAPWWTPFFALVRDNARVFQQIPAAIHEAIVLRYLRGAFNRVMTDEQLAPYAAPWLGEAGQLAFYRQIEQADQRFTDEIEPLYDRMRAPVRIVWGAQDGWLPVAQAEQLRERIPGAQLCLIEDAGHFLQEDAPQAVSATLKQFLETPTGGFASAREDLPPSG